MFENRVKKLLANSQAAWGAALPDASEVLAKFTVETGVDFLWVDLEHVSYDIAAIKWVPIICRRKDCACMIRVAGLDSQLIKRALDTGANCVMVPQINTADEAKRAVEYAKYPPQGSRGVAPYWTIQMDVSLDDYLPAANEETCVVLQIETPQGIHNLESIASVEGVDVVFAGPTDLSASLGHIGQIKHPTVQKFLAEFPSRVNACGKSAGITYIDPDDCRMAFRQGYRFIVVGSLLSYGMRGLSHELGNMRSLSAT